MLIAGTRLVGKHTDTVVVCKSECSLTTLQGEDFLPKIKLEIAVSDKLVDQTIDTIIKTATTGKIGDGKIFVLDLQEAIRVRTGEKGEEAL